MRERERIPAGKYKIGDRVVISKDLPWAGHTGTVVDTRRNPSQTDRESIYLALDNGRQVSFGFDSSLTLADVKADTAAGFDPVNNPSHYTDGGIEVLDAIEAWGLDNHAYLKDVIKYVARHEKKGNPLQDLKKAAFYLNRHIERAEKTGAYK